MISFGQNLIYRPLFRHSFTRVERDFNKALIGTVGSLFQQETIKHEIKQKLIRPKVKFTHRIYIVSPAFKRQMKKYIYSLNYGKIKSVFY